MLVPLPIGVGAIANCQWQWGQSHVISRSIYTPHSSHKKWKLFPTKQKGTTSQCQYFKVRERNLEMCEAMRTRAKPCECCQRKFSQHHTYLSDEGKQKLL
jgi:hypothetical protein